MTAAAACSQVPDAGDRCAPGTILTAGGVCLPEHANGAFPDASVASATPDAGAIADSGDSNRGGRPDTGAAAPDSGAKSIDAGSEADTGDQSDAGDLMDAAPPADTGSGASLDSGQGGTSADSGVLQLDMTGSWGIQVVNTDTVTNDTLGTQSVTVTTLGLMTAMQSGTSVQYTLQVCSVAPTAFQGFRTTYPASAIRAFAMTQGTGSLSDTTIGAEFTPSQMVLILGWQPTGDPATEQLPAGPNDPRVVDADNDGNPGVSLDVSGVSAGQIYVANRSVFAVRGNATTADHIEGATRANRAQTILGASDALLSSGNTTIAADPNGTNTFKMSRLVNLASSCDAVVQNARQLFP